MAIALRLAENPAPPTRPLPLGEKAAALWRRLAAGPLELDELHREPPEELPAVYLAVQHLWMAGALEIVNRADRPDVALVSTGAGEGLDLRGDPPEGAWRLSRFALARRKGSTLRLESPRATGRVELLQSHAAGLLALAAPLDPAALLAACPWLETPAGARDLLRLLAAAALVEKATAEGATAEDEDAVLRQWDFHDLLFHHFSRQGRHNEPLGATFRFKGELEPRPPVKRPESAPPGLPLYRPDLDEAARRDPPFSAVLEGRRSIRQHNDFAPIDLVRLGEFLFRAARNRYRYPTELGEFVSRPYPSGGASYETEVYVTANRCVGLERGFYYYDPERHELHPLSPANDDVEGLLDGAFQSCAGFCRPQILLTLASRFQRVSWKYTGMAYATQLKNIGAAYQTFYLVATAMGLAGCGLGLGDAARFCRLAKTPYLEESSIGEFMLGAPA